MEKIKLGTRAKSLGINRTVCAAGCKSRAILLDEDPRYKYIGWDDKRKKRVELNQDLVIKYGFKPMANYYYLIARLNTDMKGNVIGDDIIVEYLQLSENLNNDFADLVMENPDFNSLVLTLVKKSGPDGKDFSYIDVKTSNYQVSEEIINKVNALKENSEAIESMWRLIDATTSISAEEYEKLILAEVGDSDSQNTAPRISAPQHKQIETPRIKVETPVVETPTSVDDFGFGEKIDDFEDM